MSDRRTFMIACECLSVITDGLSLSVCFVCEQYSQAQTFAHSALASEVLTEKLVD